MADSTANIPFLIKLNTDLLVGIEIRSGANGDAAKMAANATLTVAVANAILQAGSGDVTGALAAIDAAVSSPNMDPAKAAALQTIIAWIGTKAAAVQQLASGTLLDSAVTQILNAAATEAIAVAKKYLPAPAAAK